MNEKYNVQAVEEALLPSVQNIATGAYELNHWGGIGNIRTTLEAIADKAGISKNEVLDVFITCKEGLALAMNDAVEQENILVRADIDTDSVLIHVMRLTTHIEESFPYFK